MALFGKHFVVPQPAPVFVPVPVTRPQLPDRVRNLPVVCTRHGMPVPMRFSGATYSASGHPVGNFRCPMPGCTAVEGYGIDVHTNQPRRIFARG
jgi:hypothetical protein